MLESHQQAGFDIPRFLIGIFQQVRDDFGIGFRQEPVPFLLEAIFQLQMVGDNTIVNDGEMIIAG